MGSFNLRLVSISSFIAVLWIIVSNYFIVSEWSITVTNTTGVIILALLFFMIGIITWHDASLYKRIYERGRV